MLDVPEEVVNCLYHLFAPTAKDIDLVTIADLPKNLQGVRVDGIGREAGFENLN